MKKRIIHFISEFWMLGILAIILPSIAFAHQPRIVETNYIEIENPEVSQAFYAELQGTSDIYRIESDEAFRLYAGLTVPVTSYTETDFNLGVFRLNEDDSTTELAVYTGTDFEWTEFHEEFGNDDYLSGPEFSDESWEGWGLRGKEVEAGVYLIQITSPDNEGQYVLATGDIETFPADEAFKAVVTIPKLKVQFFEKSPLAFLQSPFVMAPIIGGIILLIIIIFGGIYLIKKKRNR